MNHKKYIISSIIEPTKNELNSCHKVVILLQTTGNRATGHQRFYLVAVLFLWLDFVPAGPDTEKSEQSNNRRIRCALTFSPFRREGRYVQNFAPNCSPRGGQGSELGLPRGGGTTSPHLLVWHEGVNIISLKWSIIASWNTIDSEG